MSDGAGAAPDKPIPCPRCGTYAPIRWLGRRKVCTACVDKARHPIERSPATVRQILADVITLVLVVGPKAALVVLTINIPYALAIVLQGPTLGEDASMAAAMLFGLLALVSTAAAVDLALRHIDGQKRLSVRSSLWVGVRAWLSVLVAGLISSLISLAFMVLLVVPGIMRMLDYALLVPLIVDRDAYGADSLAKSRKRMRGHRLQALGAYLLALLPGVAAFVLFSALDDVALAELFWTHTLSEDALGLMQIAFNAVTSLLDIPVFFVAVVLHAKLRRPVDPATADPALVGS